MFTFVLVDHVWPRRAGLILVHANLVQSYLRWLIALVAATVHIRTFPKNSINNH
jgi:hypothetical protein